MSSRTPARLRDEIRRLEEDDLGIPQPDRVAPRPLGNSSEGKPGTRKGHTASSRGSGDGAGGAERPSYESATLTQSTADYEKQLIELLGVDLILACNTNCARVQFCSKACPPRGDTYADTSCKLRVRDDRVPPEWEPRRIFQLRDGGRDALIH